MNTLQPDNKDAFIATAALSETKVISNQLSTIWFLAHRCCYAEMVGARLDNRRVNFSNAHKRVVAMTISRLRGYGLRWKQWVAEGEGQRRSRVIAQKHLDKGLIFHDPDGNYHIHEGLWDEAKRLGIK